MRGQQEQTSVIEQRNESTLSRMSGACEADSQIARKERREEEFTPIPAFICCSSIEVIYIDDDDEASKRLNSTLFIQHLSPHTIKSQVLRQEGNKLGPEYQRRGRFLVWPASLGIPSFEVST